MVITYYPCTLFPEDDHEGILDHLADRKAKNVERQQYKDIRTELNNQLFVVIYVALESNIVHPRQRYAHSVFHFSNENNSVFPVSFFSRQ